MSAMGHALPGNPGQGGGYYDQGDGYDYDEGDHYGEGEIGPGWVESYAMPEEYQANNEDGSWQVTKSGNQGCRFPTWHRVTARAVCLGVTKSAG
eukprot:1737189-Pyramimonas_sp.AAC.1